MVNQASSGDAAPLDAALVARARAGDPEALDQLVARHHEAAFRVALVILGSEADAADAAQEGMVRALRALSGFRGDASFRTWLLAIVANEARSAMRRSSRRREAPLDDELPAQGGGEAVVEAIDLQRATARARALLARLPEKQRLAVQLRVDEGLSFREVGEVIGSSEGAARVNYHHGIRRLREWMEE
jgi:RNA polymerase sigma-70 factor (ECF subfamily)